MTSQPFGVSRAFLCESVRFSANRFCLATSAFPVNSAPTAAGRCGPPATKRLQESNWLQAMEGGIDSSHVSFLHRGNINSDPLFKGAKGINIISMTPVRCSKWSRALAVSTSARAATPRMATTIGASRNT